LPVYQYPKQRRRTNSLKDLDNMAGSSSKTNNSKNSSKGKMAPAKKKSEDERELTFQAVVCIMRSWSGFVYF
jgi:hypothetical protein